MFVCCVAKLFFPPHDVSLLRFTELKGLGADFVFGFVQSMDGERDPRNLLLAFQIAKNLIHRGYELGENTIISSLLYFCASLTCSSPFFCHSDQTVTPIHFLSAVSGKFTEELFEVTSCYFPIDFSPVSPCLLSWFGPRTECSRHKCHH